MCLGANLVSNYCRWFAVCICLEQRVGANQYKILLRDYPMMKQFYPAGRGLVQDDSAPSTGHENSLSGLMNIEYICYGFMMVLSNTIIKTTTEGISIRRMAFQYSSKETFLLFFFSSLNSLKFIHLYIISLRRCYFLYIGCTHYLRWKEIKEFQRTILEDLR